MFKFIHAADIHLDSPLKGLEAYEGAPVDEIRGATRRALEKLVQCAIDQQVDFLLIAGDLYDGDWKDHSTGLFFVRQMHRLREAGIPVVIISGNHDAANQMTRSLRLPDNVEMLSHKQPQTASSKRLRELGVAVHGRSFASQAEYDNLARDYPPANRGLFNIGLLHTSLEGAEGHDSYAPCTVEELVQKEYDYWALGHVHTRAVVRGNPPIVFSGNIQGRHIRETGPRGCYVVSVDHAGVPTLDFHPLDVFRWDVCEVSAETAQRGDDVLDLFAHALAKVAGRHDDLPLAVRVLVRGATRAHAELLADPAGWTEKFHGEALREFGERVWIERVKLQTTARTELDQAARTDGPLRELVQYLQDAHTDQNLLGELAGELSDLFGRLPADVQHGDDPISANNTAWLRERLDEVKFLLMTRLSGHIADPDS